MQQKLRQVLNKFDAFFDKRSIDLSVTKRGRVPQVMLPLSAHGAFNIIWPLVKKYDKKALLHVLTSGEDITEEGLSNQWVFSFDLPKRQAMLVAELYEHEETIDSSTTETHLELSVIPFAAKDSSLAIMAQDGRILRREIRSQWQERLRLRQYLPLEFIDSNKAIKSLALETHNINLQDKNCATALTAKVLLNKGPVWQLDDPTMDLQAPFAV